MRAKWNLLTLATGALSACLAIDLIVVVGTATVGISQTSPAPLKNRPSLTEQPAQPGKEAQRALRTWSVTRAARAARDRGRDREPQAPTESPTQPGQTEQEEPQFLQPPASSTTHEVEYGDTLADISPGRRGSVWSNW